MGAIARRFLEFYLRIPPYSAMYRRLGYEESELENGGNDRLIDAVVAWGDGESIAERVRAHLDAGADHVCLQVLREDPTELARQEWRELAALPLD